MMFDLTTARLVEQKILLPGVTVLSRLISAVRERVANRTWKILSQLPNDKQIENLEALIVVVEKARLTPLAKIVTKLDRLGQIAPVFGLFFSTKILIKGDLSPSTSRLQPLLAESLSSFVEFYWSPNPRGNFSPSVQ